VYGAPCAPDFFLNYTAREEIYTNDHFLTDTTKDEKWLVLVGRPSLAAISVGGRGRPPHGTEARPTELFSYKSALKKGNFL
jgi:hypothetical protein